MSWGLLLLLTFVLQRSRYLLIQTFQVLFCPVRFNRSCLGFSQGSVSFEYRPLHARPSTVRLSLHSPELGHFHYDLSLRALPAPPERTVHFSAALGRSHMEAVKFLNYSHVKAEYSCWVSFSGVPPVPTEGTCVFHGPICRLTPSLTHEGGGHPGGPFLCVHQPRLTNPESSSQGFRACLQAGFWPAGGALSHPCEALSFG